MVGAVIVLTVVAVYFIYKLKLSRLKVGAIYTVFQELRIRLLMNNRVQPSRKKPGSGSVRQKRNWILDPTFIFQEKLKNKIMIRIRSDLAKQHFMFTQYISIWNCWKSKELSFFFNILTRVRFDTASEKKIQIQLSRKNLIRTLPTQFWPKRGSTAVNSDDTLYPVPGIQT